ncbi:peptidoglycan D,D-transpeptidase FtsI family protein [Pontiella agarivorans]|uniref:beta-lactamase n=1 Tax=Pontiella agarivorans TaxID=3038953 RepID=A0ABU5MX08_9BACT|nr:penicillin-binding transpeptidase domain-containing protein [Pontiella agarivorans]MDZ8118728.1 penicillin-binding transpeptidase domain-containing protein [Pontiella agarivorans]
MAIKVKQKQESSSVVIWAVFGIMMASLLFLGSRLWNLQVRGKSGFDEVFHDQSVRRVRLPAVRGKIFDTNGEVLADSVPNYCIAIYTEEMRAPRSAVANTLELMHRIWQSIGVAPDISYRDVKRHFALTPNEPLVVWKGLDDEKLGVWQGIFGRWNDERKIPGLKKHDPLRTNRITFNTKELSKTPTSTAANTLELVYEISDRIGIPRKVRYQQIVDHIILQKPLPLLAWQNLNDATIAKWADTCSMLPGTDIYYQPARTYPFGETNAHLIGFTLAADAINEAEDTGEKIHYDMRGIEGRKGLEGTYNDLLEGEPGYNLVRIDASGYHHSDIQTRFPKPGGDLQLTIDQKIQQFAMEALLTKQDGEDPNLPVKGACVVLDPNNGDVLAMVSAPSFNPNAYMASAKYRLALNKDPFSRTFHRAVFGQYPPGSTFKPIAVLGALRNNPDYANVYHDCHNPYYVGKRRMKCWIHSRYGEHGEVNARQALMVSCNVYMFEMVQELGYEPIRDMAHEFGIGQYAGLFPNLDDPPEQKDVKYGNLPDHALNTIDACNMSIGQGAILASPLQMAMVASTIANGGRVYRPRLVKKWRNGPDDPYNTNPTWAYRQLDVPIEALEVVRGGMHDVVNHPEGSAKAAALDGVLIAGKTGSAQYKKLVDGEVVSSVHTWMISYAPYHFPKYAVAMLVEDGVSGGRSIGPRLHDLYAKIFEYDGTISKGDS